MPKIVINARHSGFGLSEKALAMLPDGYTDRADPRLVAVVEQLGEAANDRFSKLKIVEIPDGVAWHIAEYDGLEWVAENHRTWH